MTDKNSENKFEEWYEAYKSEDGYNYIIPSYKINRFTNLQKTIDEQAERIKTLEAENALLKESNERLENSLREFKVFGTDECTECVNEKGRAQLGESYNRITLFYKPKEHSIHKQN